MILLPLCLWREFINPRGAVQITAYVRRSHARKKTKMEQFKADNPLPWYTDQPPLALTCPVKVPEGNEWHREKKINKRIQ